MKPDRGDVGGPEVRLISATVVPVKRGRAAARPRISIRRALAIARRVVAGREASHAPQLVAYAGDPARGLLPRLAYVIEMLGAVAKGDDAPTGLCVVVDARTGRVLTTWKGNAAPASARHIARSAGAVAVAASGLRRSVTIVVNDAQKPAPPPTSQDPPTFGIEIGSHYGDWGRQAARVRHRPLRWPTGTPARRRPRGVVPRGSSRCWTRSCATPETSSCTCASPATSARATGDREREAAPGRPSR